MLNFASFLSSVFQLSYPTCFHIPVFSPTKTSMTSIFEREVTELKVKVTQSFDYHLK